MQRSTGKNLQINHSDFLLAKEGKKTCTSRYGDRADEYPVGQIFNFCDNDDGSVLKIRITRRYMKLLKDVTSSEAFLIGNYTWADHVADFYGVYAKKLGRDVHEDTVVTIIHFELVE